MALFPSRAAFARDDSAHSPLSNLITSIVGVGIVLAGNVSAEKPDAATGYGILRRNPGKGEDALGSPLADAESNTTIYIQASVTQESVRSTYRAKAFGRSRKSGQVNLAYMGLPDCSEADQPDSADSGSDQGEPAPSPNPGTDTDRRQPERIGCTPLDKRLHRPRSRRRPQFRARPLLRSARALPTSHTEFSLSRSGSPLILPAPSPRNDPAHAAVRAAEPPVNPEHSHGTPHARNANLDMRFARNRRALRDSVG